MYVVVHATKKPPGTTNLISEEDNQTDNSITQIIKEKLDKKVLLLSTRHNLSANFSRIVNRRHIPND
jgi:hypothetical protein